MMRAHGIFAVLAIAFVTVSEAKPPQKIVGGTSAALGEFPYQISMRLKGQHFCGGTIIGKRHILTAAHCVDGVVSAPYTDLRIVTGAISTRFGGQTHRVAKIIHHKKYDTRYTSSPYDIAVVVLAGDMKFNADQNKIALASSITPTGVVAVVSGWGLTVVNGRPSPDLLMIYVMTLAPKDCQGEIGKKAVIRDNQICTQVPTGSGVCQGDSGGPLVYKNELIGVVSYGVPCGFGHPDVFTSVYHYVDWIKEAMAST